MYKLPKQLKQFRSTTLITYLKRPLGITVLLGLFLALVSGGYLYSARNADVVTSNQPTVDASSGKPTTETTPQATPSVAENPATAPSPVPAATPTTTNSKISPTPAPVPAPRPTPVQPESTVLSSISTYAFQSTGMPSPGYRNYTISWSPNGGSTSSEGFAVFWSASIYEPDGTPDYPADNPNDTFDGSYINTGTTAGSYTAGFAQGYTYLYQVCALRGGVCGVTSGVSSFTVPL